MPEKFEIIIELLKQGNANEAIRELENLQKSGDKSATSFENMTRNAKAAFAAIGGTQLLRAAINEFVESERAIAKMTVALRNAGELSTTTLTEMRDMAKELAEAFGVQDEAVLNVSAKLISFGARRQDVARLTETVFNLATVLDRDMNRAVIAVGNALRGDVGIFEQFNITVDKSGSATEKLNQGLLQLEKQFGGQAREAMKGFVGEVEGLNLRIKEMIEDLGGWIAKAALGITALGARMGTARGSLSEKDRDEQRINLFRSLNTLHAEGKITVIEADAMKKEVLDAFKGDTTVEGAPLQQLRFPVRNVERENQALANLIDKISVLSGIANPNGGQPPVAQPRVTTGALSEADRLAGIQAVEDFIAEELEREKEAQETLRKLEQQRFKEKEAAIQQVAQQQREADDAQIDMVNELILVGKTGRERERADLDITHQRRLRQIEEITQGNRDMYLELAELADMLHEKEVSNFEFQHSAAGQFQADLKEIGAVAREQFASGLAHALVTSFEEGDKAFQKFAVNFLRTIAEMIAKVAILQLLTGIGRALSGAGGGGVGRVFSIL